MDITLIGGHGQIALLAHPLLARAGHTVHAVIRNPDHAAQLEELGVRPVVADIETLDADGWDELLRGSDAVVWAAGAGGGDPRRTRAVDQDAAIAAADAAARVGSRRFVLISYFGAGPDHGIPEGDPFHAYAEAKAAADTHLRDSGLDWTILGPSRLTDDPGTGRIDLEAEQSGAVSRENVARTVVEALAQPATIRRTLAYNDGPQEIAAAFAELG